MKFMNLKNNINCDNVIQCIYELNTLDIQVYKTLRETGETRADDLANKLSKDRSNVYRSLQKLTCCRLCVKEKRNIKNGGYYHIYFCADSTKVKRELEEQIDSWYNKMKNTLEALK
jgi:predicted transcriptional regulator